MFRFLFTAENREGFNVEAAMAAGQDYYEDVFVEEIYVEVQEKYKRALDEAKIKVEKKVPSGLTLRCMRVSVSRAIDNCVKNSIRHLKEKAQGKRLITLRAKNVLKDGQWVTNLSVTDNASGIEKDKIDKMVKPFVSGSGGMGLGLSIVRTVCEIHGGEMSLHSKWGFWTTVLLQFPKKEIQRKKGKRGSHYGS